MKVEIKLSMDTREPYAVIYTDEITQEVRRIASVFQAADNVITAGEGGRTVILKPEEIFMVRVENEKTIIYCREKSYQSGKRLYELEKQLGKDFMRISKSSLIQLKKLESVEPSFNGIMLLTLKNGCKDYISRKYLSELKKYLGL